MAKTQQKQTMDDDFWVEVSRALRNISIYGGIIAIIFLISFSIALYIVG